MPYLLMTSVTTLTLTANPLHQFAFLLRANYHF